MRVHITDTARQAIQDAAAGADGDCLRVRITPRLEHELMFDTQAEGDTLVEVAGLRVILDAASARLADGLSIDFVDGPEGPGFAIDNPNQPASVRPLSAPGLKAFMQEGKAFELVDVRTPQERAIARIDGSRLLDEGLRKEILTLDRDTTIVFQCHHGMRSQAAAEYFLGQGFRNVYNLTGGIDAWSALVDPAIPRY